MIPTITLAPGLVISRVLTGLWQIADMEKEGRSIDPGTTAQAMLPYATAGLTTFDMADHYGSAELVAGMFRKRFALPAVQLLTKWVPGPGVVTEETVRTAVHSAMSRLQTDCIDLMQFHTWDYADPRWLDCLFWLQELKREGLIANLGVTNFDTVHLNMAIQSGIEIVSNQVCFSLLDQRAANRMTQLCLKSGIKILAFGTVAGGFFSEKWLNKPEPVRLESWSLQKYKRFIDAAGGWLLFQELLQTLSELAREQGVSISNMASRFILEQPAVAGVIIGARLGQTEHIQNNAGLFDFTLNAANLARLTSACARLTPIPGDCGDEYRKPPFLTASGDLSDHVRSFPPPYQAHNYADGKTRIFSGTPWESMAGFCRGIKKGNSILVSGTTATHGARAIGGKDAAAQTHFIIDKIEGTLKSMGASLDDVVRTRVFVKRMSDWEVVARAHGERFAGRPPANTLVCADLIGDDYLVEIEADALVD